MKTQHKWFWQIAVLAVLTIIFWHPVLFNNGFFYDDWDFIKTFKLGQASPGYFFAPHNEHFMPMFKIIFFCMYNAFGLNFAPYAALLILTHIVNVGLFFYLCRILFPKSKGLPFILAAIFLSNTAYYEVLHWFILLCTGLSLAFLQIALICLNRYQSTNQPKYLWISAASSFFIPMNFSIGLIGFFIILLYYFLAIKKGLKLKQHDVWTIEVYFAAWLLFLMFYFVFVFNQAIIGKSSGIMAFNLGRVIVNVLAGFGGFFIKSMGVGILIHPINIWAAAILIFNLICFGFFMGLDFILNDRSGRRKWINPPPLGWFAFLGALLSYLIVAAARADLSADCFLNWGRYQYYPGFFITIFLGCIGPQIIENFSRIFKRRRFKIYLIFLLIVFLLGQYVMIRQKAESTIRTEGLVIDQGSLVAGLPEANYE